MLVHYDSSKHCTCALKKCVKAFKVLKLSLKHPELLGTFRLACILSTH
jgi:hypothetical protein